MVVSVPEEKWPRLRDLCASEGVEATSIGRFVPTNQLELKYGGETVGKLDMHFLHEGRPKVERQATYKSLSENRRGLAHFAQYSEQNVPVPLVSDGSGWALSPKSKSNERSRCGVAGTFDAQRHPFAAARLAQYRQQRMGHSPVRP